MYFVLSNSNDKRKSLSYIYAAVTHVVWNRPDIGY